MPRSGAVSVLPFRSQHALGGKQETRQSWGAQATWAHGTRVAFQIHATRTVLWHSPTSPVVDAAACPMLVDGADVQLVTLAHDSASRQPSALTSSGDRKRADALAAARRAAVGVGRDLHAGAHARDSRGTTAPQPPCAARSSVLHSMRAPSKSSGAAPCDSEWRRLSDRFPVRPKPAGMPEADLAIGLITPRPRRPARAGGSIDPCARIPAPTGGTPRPTAGHPYGVARRACRLNVHGNDGRRTLHEDGIRESRGPPNERLGVAARQDRTRIQRQHDG
jgi:hypothetical protein